MSVADGNRRRASSDGAATEVPSRSRPGGLDGAISWAAKGVRIRWTVKAASDVAQCVAVRGHWEVLWPGK